MIGPTLSHYKIHEKLGSGGMGEVFLAEDTTLHREVALKVLPPEMAESPERCKLFEREARAAAALNHPNIVTIHSVEQTEGVHFITMELVRGKTLYDIIRSAGPLALRDILNITVQVAEGLAEAHSRNIIHRDLKPQNVMVTDEGRAKILDFGLAKALYPTQQGHLVTSEAETISAGLRREGKVVGTIAYMSPEQTVGKEVDSRSDVFSFGTMLYEMASGRRPFKGDTVTSTIAKILESEPEPLGELRPDVPFDLIRIVRRCLHKDPDARYNDTRDLVVDLKDLQQEVTSGAVSRASGAIAEGKGAALPWIALGKQQRRKLTFGALGIVALLTAVAITVFVLVRRPSGPIARPQPTHRQLTFIGDAQYPTISPDGKTIAYVSGKAGHEQRVMIQDITGGQALEVFQGTECSFLRWSPNGSELLFTASSNDKNDTVLVPRLGGAARRFPLLNYLTWSHDGSQFAGTYYAGKHIEVIEKSTGNRRQISLSGSFAWLHDVDWSPAGNLILFLTIDDQTRYTVWTIAPDGSNQRRLIESSEQLLSPRWSPTGDAIYYLYGEGQSKQLYRIPVSFQTGDATAPASVAVPGLQAGGYFTLSGDGKRLLHTVELRHSNLWLFAVDGSDENQPLHTTQVTEGTYLTERPSVSPDGDRVAFSRGDGKTANIFVVPIEGGSPQQLTVFNSYNGSPVWSPDGSEIAFASNEGGIGKVWKVSANGGTPYQFESSELGSSSFTLAWSPGPNILYHRTGNRNFHVLNPVAEEEAPLVQDESVGWMFHPRYSPDGTKVAVSWNRKPSRGLWLISLEDSSHVPLYEGWVSPIGWSLDGDWIYVLDEENKKILLVPVSGDEPKTLAELSFDGKAEGWGVSMTPDGKRFVFAVYETRSDVWLVENFDPDLQ